MNIWAVGDIHGRSDLLRLILEKLDKAGLNLQKDKLIFLGDYIDRGPDSKGVVDIVMNLDKNPNVICLLGNHDDFLLDAFKHKWKGKPQAGIWSDLRNGGWATFKSFGCVDKDADEHFDADKIDLDKIPTEVVDWFKKLHLFHHELGFFFSHSPLPREKYRQRYKDKPFDRSEYTWTRPIYGGDEFGICRRIDPKRDGTVATIGVCGHNKIDYTPRLFDHYYCIDTICGCHPKGRLTAIECKSKTIIQALPDEFLGYKEAVRLYKFEQKEHRKRLRAWGMI